MSCGNAASRNMNSSPERGKVPPAEASRSGVGGFERKRRQNDSENRASIGSPRKRHMIIRVDPLPQRQQPLRYFPPKGGLSQPLHDREMAACS